MVCWSPVPRKGRGIIRPQNSRAGNRQPPQVRSTRSHQHLALSQFFINSAIVSVGLIELQSILRSSRGIRSGVADWPAACCPHPSQSSDMDCGSTEPPSGFESNFLENWQSDGAFSIASWERPGFDRSPEWDTSQESSQADIGEFSSLQGAQARDQQEGSHNLSNLDYRSAFPSNSPR